MTSEPKPEFRVGIVGSRRRATLIDRRIVFDIIHMLVATNPDMQIVLVSGACPKGADSFAAEHAKIFGTQIKEFPVPKKKYAHKGEWVAEAFARNRLIVENSDVIFALRAADKTGGTENTIKHAQELKKKTYEVDENGNLLLIVAGEQSRVETPDEA